MYWTIRSEFSTWDWLECKRKICVKLNIDDQKGNKKEKNILKVKQLLYKKRLGYANVSVT